jgi:hypothetical protein
MKPQIVSFNASEAGRHNIDLANSVSKLTKGGSWKKQRIVMLIPAGEHIPTKVYLSHMNIVYPPNQAVVRLAAVGMEVGEAFSSSIEGILAHPELKDWEYLLTIEHDNIPPADGVLKLIKRMEEHPEFACIGGLYWTKGEGGVPQIWGDKKDPVMNFRPQPPVPGQLVECWGTGMGFNLWRLSMFKDPKLRKPWFKTLTGIEGTGVGTQDLYFWGDAQKHGYRCAIDCSVLVGHYSWQEDVVW